MIDGEYVETIEGRLDGLRIDGPLDETISGLVDKADDGLPEGEFDDNGDTVGSSDANCEGFPDIIDGLEDSFIEGDVDLAVVGILDGLFNPIVGTGGTTVGDVVSHVFGSVDGPVFDGGRVGVPGVGFGTGSLHGVRVGSLVGSEIGPETIGDGVGMTGASNGLAAGGWTVGDVICITGELVVGDGVVGRPSVVGEGIGAEVGISEGAAVGGEFGPETIGDAVVMIGASNGLAEGGWTVGDVLFVTGALVVGDGVVGRPSVVGEGIGADVGTTAGAAVGGEFGPEAIGDAVVMIGASNGLAGWTVGDVICVTGALVVGDGVVGRPPVVGE